MKKTIKVNLIVWAVIFALFSVSLGICYVNIRENIKADYADSKYDLTSDLYLEAASTLDDEEFDTYKNVDDFLSNANGRLLYPYRVVVHDMEGNEIGRTGSQLNFSSRTMHSNLDYFAYYSCFIDEYLTEELRETLGEYAYSDLFLHEFGYAFENGNSDKIIPVYINYEDGYGNVVKTITFTENEVEGTIVVPNDYLNLYLDYTSDVDYGKKSYDIIDNAINSEEYKICLTSENDSTIENEDGIYYSRFDGLCIGDARYKVMLVSYADIHNCTLYSYDFLKLTRIFTAVYMIALVIITTLVDYYLKRNRLNKAKYAFTNAAAHEFKTPLAVIENKCEFILEGVDNSKTIQYVNETYKEALKMHILLNNLLRYNKLSTQSKIEKAANNLTQLVHNEIEKYRSSAEVKNITLVTDLIDAEVSCNAELISLTIGNFISNAVKFSPSDSTVAVNLEKIKNKYKLSIINTFEGTLDNKIWDMLYMTDESRNGNSTGMGLPTSKEILELHNYKYGFKNKDSTVEFYFIAK